MNILQVNTSDAGGGAESVAWNLFRSYQQRGHRSWLAVGDKHTNLPEVFTTRDQRPVGVWRRTWRAGGNALAPLVGRVRGAAKLRMLCDRIGEPQRLRDWWKGREEFDFPGSWQLLDLPPERPDVVHCHNLHGPYFDLMALPWLSRQAPLVITLHDAWLLSGHCAHSFECERWRTGCGRCPDLTIPPAVRRDETAYNLRRKKDIYGESRLYVATPSRWLMQKVEGSVLCPAMVEGRVIPNGVDLGVFHPGDRAAARDSLGIPQDAKVLLFVANGIRRNIWKDFQTLRSALAIVAERGSVDTNMLIALGDRGPDEHSGQAVVRFVPYEKDPTRVADYYRAADAYIHAARADNFPNTVLEAMACGTPVVATAVGGIPEQVADGETGFLVPPGDPQAMATRIEQILKDSHLQQWLAQNAAAEAAKRFSLVEQVDRYLSWYQEILERDLVGPAPPDRASNR